MMRAPFAVLIVVVAVAAPSCSKAPVEHTAANAPAPNGVAGAPPSPNAAAVAASPPNAAAVAAPSAPVPCGALGCLAFATPEAAFDRVLAEQPRVLGVGETHAQKGDPAVPSATHRFGAALLPRLAGKASEIVIELWVATGQCGTVERRAAAQQRPVTEQQADTNQGEFVALGQRAKALGIAPHALTPSCEQYRAIAGAGANDVDRMLEMIKDTTLRDVDALLMANQKPDAQSLIVSYGGALHNDLVPRADHERWSYGPELARQTDGRYVELDLIVPEFIKDSESWRAFAWYPHYDRSKQGTQTWLFSPAPHAFVLIFPPATAPLVTPEATP